MSEQISIQLDVQGWNIVRATLGRQPYDDVAPVIHEIQRQMMEREAAKRATNVTPLHPVEEAG